MEAHFFWNGTFSAASRGILRNGWEVPADIGTAAGRQGRAATGLNRFLCMDQLCYLPDDILTKWTA